MRTNTTEDCPVCGRRLWQTDWRIHPDGDYRRAVQYCERRRDNNAKPTPTFVRAFSADPYESADLAETHFYRVVGQRLTAVGWIDNATYEHILAVALGAASFAVVLGLAWALLLTWIKLHGG